MRHRVRSRLARWFASRSASDFHVLTRVEGLRVELHALHRPSGHRFVSMAADFETAAGALTRLIETTFAALPAAAGGSPSPQKN